MQLYRPCAFIALTLAPFSAGCSSCSGEKSDVAPISSVDTTDPFAPGDRVVAEYARAAFFEGTVTVVGSEGLTVQEHGTGQAREVDSANVYRLDKGKLIKTAWKPGELAICHAGSQQWQGCRVEKADSSQVSVIGEKGERISLAPASLLVPTPVTQLNLEHAFERVEKAKAFALDVKNAGAPFRPSDWKPREGEPILLRTGSSYVSAVVKEPRAALLLVQLMGTNETPRAVAIEDAWPEPPVDASLTVGGYACIRPPADEHLWQIVRIDGKLEDKVQVSTPTGEERTVEEKDLLPFDPKRPQ
jgi:hypothetical protein